MRILAIGIALYLAALAHSRDDLRTPDERLAALKKEYDLARTAFIQKVLSSKDDEERQKIISESNPGPKFAEKFLALAKENAKTDTAVDALTWIIANTSEGEPNKTAIELLSKDYVKSSRLAVICFTHNGTKRPLH
jgi:hypothetical protein